MRLPTSLFLAGLALALLPIGPASHAQPAPDQDGSTDVEEVVVVARRAGLPMWRLTRGAGTVVLVGAIERIPGDAPWRPEALEAAIAKADAVILEPKASASPLDLGRLLVRGRRTVFLPKGQTVASRYGAELDRRLAAQAAAGKIDERYNRTRPIITGWELLPTVEGPHRRSYAPDAGDVAERAAKQFKVRARPVLKGKVRTWLDELSTDSPDDLVCLQAALEAVEQGPEGARRRAEAWKDRRIPEVLASPIERADQACGFGRRGALGKTIRAAWRTAVAAELAKPGVVVAVAPLATVAGQGGLLDDLRAQGVTITGPRWREDQPLASSGQPR